MKSRFSFSSGSRLLGVALPILLGCGGPNSDLQDSRGGASSAATYAILDPVQTHLQIKGGQDNLFILAVNAPLDQVLNELARQAQVDIDRTSVLIEKNNLVNLFEPNISFDTLLTNLIGDQNLLYGFNQAQELTSVTLLPASHMSDEYETFLLDMQDHNLNKRLQVVTASENLANEERNELYRHVMANNNQTLRLELVESLTHNDGPITLELLGEAIYDRRSEIREAAVEALSRLNSDSATPLLAVALNDPDAGIREEAVEALGRINNSDSNLLLERALNDNDATVRSLTEAFVQTSHR